MQLLIRVFDILLSLLGIILGFPLLIIIFIIGILDTGSPLFIQARVGKNKKLFKLVKFRTMKKNTESVPTHLNRLSNITRFGGFLRKTKLDELPQLWNVLLGDMSLVGPRPGLINQEELTFERDKKGIYTVRPGITGLAQIQHIDMSTPELLAKTDAKMINNLTVFHYFKYILLTILGRGSGDRIK